MNITEFTARKLAKIDQAAIDARLTDQDFRLLWLILSAADKKPESPGGSSRTSRRHCAVVRAECKSVVIAS